MATPWVAKASRFTTWVKAKCTSIEEEQEKPGIDIPNEPCTSAEPRTSSDSFVLLPSASTIEDAQLEETPLPPRRYSAETYTSDDDFTLGRFVKTIVRGRRMAVGGDEEANKGREEGDVESKGESSLKDVRRRSGEVAMESDEEFYKSEAIESGCESDDDITRSEISTGGEYDDVTAECYPRPSISLTSLAEDEEKKKKEEDAIQHSLDQLQALNNTIAEKAGEKTGKEERKPRHYKLVKERERGRSMPVAMRRVGRVPPSPFIISHGVATHKNVAFGEGPKEGPKECPKLWQPEVKEKGPDDKFVAKNPDNDTLPDREALEKELQAIRAQAIQPAATKPIAIPMTTQTTNRGYPGFTDAEWQDMGFRVPPDVLDCPRAMPKPWAATPTGREIHTAIVKYIMTPAVQSTNALPAVIRPHSFEELMRKVYNDACEIDGMGSIKYTLEHTGPSHIASFVGEEAMFDNQLSHTFGSISRELYLGAILTFTPTVAQGLERDIWWWKHRLNECKLRIEEMERKVDRGYMQDTFPLKQRVMVLRIVHGMIWDEAQRWSEARGVVAGIFDDLGAR